MAHLTQNAQELKVYHLQHLKKYLQLIYLPKDQHPQSMILLKDSHHLKRRKPKCTQSLHLPKFQHRQTNLSISQNRLIPGGCLWSQTDWSCAYDSFFMIFFYMYHSSSESWRTSWPTYSPLAVALDGYFEQMSLAYNNGHQPNFNQN